MAFENYLIHLGILLCVYVMLTISLNLSVGFTGLLNLGHIAFFGIGAYASALLVLHGYPLWAGILGAALIAGIVGALLAVPTSRLKGDYLALATLGFLFICGTIARNWTGLTRGPLGLPGIPRYTADNQTLLVIAAGTTLAMICIIWIITRTRFGKTLQAIRDDELAAQMLGKNTFAHKIASMGLSALLAGIAGSFFAHYISFIDPSTFSSGDTILVFSMLIVGGLASLPGSLLGAAIILLIPEPLRFIGFPSALVGPMREILFALILLLILIYRPKGIFGKVDFP
jgi:branched-chain amino acid transport system permease protein